MNRQQTYWPAPSYKPWPKKASQPMSNLWMSDAVVTGMGMKQRRPLETEVIDTTVGMLDEMVQHAVQDATQSHDPGLRWEAVAWLWVCCPDIAEQLLLTWPESMPATIDVQQQAAAYLERYPA